MRVVCARSYCTQFRCSVNRLCLGFSHSLPVTNFGRWGCVASQVRWVNNCLYHTGLTRFGNYAPMRNRLSYSLSDYLSISACSGFCFVHSSNPPFLSIVGKHRTSRIADLTGSFSGTLCHFELVYLPVTAPDLNPQEHIAGGQMVPAVANSVCIVFYIPSLWFCRPGAASL